MADQTPEQAAPGPTVVVLDDEDGLREIMCRMLRTRGFTAIGTGTPAEALELCQTPGAAVDVLVTDLGVPSGFGVEVARRAEASRPGLPVVFVSGVSKADAVQRGLLTEDAVLVQKPFSREALVAVVRSALDRAGHDASD
jgi:DNA-binding response OmpR family regulator